MENKGIFFGWAGGALWSGFVLLEAWLRGVKAVATWPTAMPFQIHPTPADEASVLGPNCS